MQAQAPKILASPKAQKTYHLVVTLVGLALLLAGSLWVPPSTHNLPFALIICLFIAFQVIFPFHLLGGEISIIHILTLGSGLLFGPMLPAWSAVFGMLLGYLVRNEVLPRLQHSQPFPRRIVGSEMLYNIGIQVSALISVLLVFNWRYGMASNPAAFSLSWTRVLGIMLLFAGLHGGLFLADAWASLRLPGVTFQRDLINLCLLELLPAPFILTAALSYSKSGLGPLVTLGVIPLILAILIYEVTSIRADLERRIQALSALNQISQVLRSNLELNNLLSTLHLLVSQFLSVDNFYVALYNPQTEEIWYPLAVKNGQPVQWPARPLADRLTDRIIREGKPILLPYHARDEIERIGMPPGDEPLQAWMGVPLISEERVIGCLAVFSFSPQVTFTPVDLNFLLTLSGQASVAIVNSLLQEQVQRRVRQLEKLNQITNLVTESLNPEEVLAQVCRAVAQVAGGNRSAVFILDPDAGQVWLAYAHELSEGFVRSNQTFSIAHNGRTRCLRTGLPSLASDLNQVSLDSEFLAVLSQEGIRALGDFPLITPEGQIGYLSVYYNVPHTFQQDEVELLQTFASQAALAVSSARLQARTDMVLSQRANQLSILEAVGRELGAAIQSDSLFEMILDYALEFTNSSWGNISLFDPYRQELQVKAARGYPGPLSTYPIDQGISGRVARTLQPINSADIRQEPDYTDMTGGKASSLLAIPLLHEGRILGILTLESTQANAYTANDQAFITQLANQASIAVVNAELYAAVSHGRDRMEAVLNSVDEGILMLDTSGQILLANESIYAITHVPREELVGKNLAELPAAQLAALGYYPDEVQGLLPTLALGYLPTTPKTIIKTPASADKHILERLASPVWGENERVIGWMILLRDVTEEYRVAESRELITETMVHDLRSPLGVILGALDVISGPGPDSPPADPETTAEAMSIARRSAQRVLSLVESLLDIARLQTGNMETTLVPSDLNALADNVLSELLPQAQEYGISLSSSIPVDFPRVRADAGKITRVLTNLVDNALKFTPPDGQVVLSATIAPNHMAAVMVSDTGPGVPPEFRQKIFERFTQIPGVHGRRRGSGLGLTFCRLAVEAHGGRISVEPRPGGGSIFSFTLPLAEIVPLSEAASSRSTIGY